MLIDVIESKNKVLQQLADIAVRADEAVNRILHAERQWNKCLNTLMNDMDDIHKAYKSAGLNIENISVSKIGSSMDSLKWTDEDRMMIHITSVPKFKYIPFTGYKRNGQSRTYARREKKASLIRETIQSKLPPYRYALNINACSLESRNESPTNRLVMTSMTMKSNEK
jgi:hypothetical protein